MNYEVRTAVRLIACAIFQIDEIRRDLDYDLNIPAGCAIRYADAARHPPQFRITELSD